MRELAELQISASAVPGGVAFSGGWDACYRANLWSRMASRVLWRITEFGYRNEHDLYAAVRAIDWPRYFRVERTLRVNVTAQRSPLKSLEFATLRIKDAVCDRFREVLGKRPSVERANPDVRVHAFLEAEQATLYLDTSGEPLFKRGWRTGAAEAPLRENLAAGIVALSGWRLSTLRYGSASSASTWARSACRNSMAAITTQERSRRRGATLPRRGWSAG